MTYQTCPMCPMCPTLKFSPKSSRAICAKNFGLPYVSKIFALFLESFRFRRGKI